MRTVLVYLHAVPGVIGLVAGLPAMAPPRLGDRRTWWRLLYALCVALLVAAVVMLVAYDWSGLATPTRAVFAGLVGLGAVMGYRLWRAHLQHTRQSTGWQQRYVGHVYFTYVSLWIGFLIVPALATPLPQVAVPVAVAVVLGTGHVLLSRYRRRLEVPGAGPE